MTGESHNHRRAGAERSGGPHHDGGPPPVGQRRNAVPTGLPRLAQHLGHLQQALDALGRQSHKLESWGRHLAAVLDTGGRLLACGNGGSAAEAQHLTAELVGRYQRDRRPLSAIALHAETSSLTAIANDYGFENAFARQVRAHGRPGDVLILLSTSGRSANVIEAARAGRAQGLLTWALTGGGRNNLAAVCDDAIVVDAPTPATVQETHLAAVHMLCAAVDDALQARAPARCLSRANGVSA